MIYIRTCAYNAEQTLERAIKSVLKQTYSSFVYYLMDNGSIDKTGEIVREYANRDSRIIPFWGKKNNDKEKNKEFWDIPNNIADGDYFCTLDADDWYENTFFEEMLGFISTNNLDMAACGTTFFDATSGKAVGERVLQENCILVGADSYDRFFPNAHWNFRQVWGKLYSAKTVKNRMERIFPSWYPKAYGGDTIKVLESAKLSDRIGIYGKSLHNYSISQKSISHKWIPGRIESDVTLYEKTMEFLKQKCGRVSKRNQEFMYVIYYNSLKDTMPVLFQSDLSKDEKLKGVEQMLTHPVTYSTWECDLSAMGLTTEDKGSWLDSVIGNFSAVFKGRKKVRLLQLVQSLAALSQDEERYVRYSKNLIEQYISNGEYSLARMELDEWEPLLPKDEDLKKYRRRASF